MLDGELKAIFHESSSSELTLTLKTFSLLKPLVISSLHFRRRVWG